MLGLLRQLQPRAAVIIGCAMLAMAGVAAAVAKDHNGAIVFGATGALLISLGSLAWLARRSSHQPAAPNPVTTIAALCWLALYALTLVVILTEPAILHRAFGTEAFHLPIEYVSPAALALLLLPLWPGFMGFASLLQQAMRKGRGGTLGVLLLQIDSDIEAGMEWGDVGRLYLCARKEEVAAQRSDRCWMIMQCY